LPLLFQDKRTLQLLLWGGQGSSIRDSCCFRGQMRLQIAVRKATRRVYATILQAGRSRKDAGASLPQALCDNPDVRVREAEQLFERSAYKAALSITVCSTGWEREWVCV
jgi:hypothetical protein